MGPFEGMGGVFLDHDYQAVLDTLYLSDPTPACLKVEVEDRGPTLALEVEHEENRTTVSGAGFGSRV